MRGALLVCGTHSDAGKSVVTAGICRWLHRSGVRVAPFKAQNMALNSVVAPDGSEIGRSQAMQAAAAGVEPEAAMNPILIKPSGERHSQVVVMGHPYADAGARSYQAMKDALRPVVATALAGLRERHDVVVCEGAGSPAEINLREGDLTNMGLARAANLPVIVVADIDRGGVFASLFGTLALLDAADQAHVAGFVINKFRGDDSILAPGITRIEELTGRPVLGVLPHVEDLWLDVEDSLALETGRREQPAGADTLDVAVVRLRWMSNFTDADALAAEPGVRVRFTRSAADIERADLVVIPGTKATVEDLERLRRDGLDRALAARAEAGDPILGICGGYQLLGERIDDGVESRRGTVEGLGLLPVTTTFAPDKLLRRPTGFCAWLRCDGVLPRAGLGGGRVEDPPRPLRAPRGRAAHGRRGLPRRQRARPVVARRARARRVPPRAARPRRRGARPALRPGHDAVRRRPRRAPRHARRPHRPARRHGAPGRADRGRRAVRPAHSRDEGARVLRFVTTADTEILAAATAVERLGPDFPEVRWANPATGVDLDELLDGARVGLCRILGGPRGWIAGFDELRERCEQRGIALLALGGEAEPDAEMTALSTAPAGAVAQAGADLRHGDVDNVEQLLRFLADTFLLEGHGFEPPHEVADLGVYVPGRGDVEIDEALAAHDPARPTIGICFYRSHRLTGNTAFVDALCAAIEAAGGNALAVWSYSLRRDQDGRVPALELIGDRVDALVVTMLATGGSSAGDAVAAEGGDGVGEAWQEWDASALAGLGVAVIQ